MQFRNDIVKQRWRKLREPAAKANFRQKRRENGVPPKFLHLSSTSGFMFYKVARFLKRRID
jgi:hypothetical protein